MVPAANDRAAQSVTSSVLESANTRAFSVVRIFPAARSAPRATSERVIVSVATLASTIGGPMTVCRDIAAPVSPYFAVFRMPVPASKENSFTRSQSEGEA